MGKRFRELRGRVTEEAPVNATGDAVSTSTPVVRRNIPAMLRRIMPKVAKPKKVLKRKTRL
jgi:hypothetical protein